MPSRNRTDRFSAANLEHTGSALTIFQLLSLTNTSDLTLSACRHSILTELNGLANCLQQRHLQSPAHTLCRWPEGVWQISYRCLWLFADYRGWQRPGRQYTQILPFLDHAWPCVVRCRPKGDPAQKLVIQGPVQCVTISDDTHNPNIAINAQHRYQKMYDVASRYVALLQKINSLMDLI